MEPNDTCGYTTVVTILHGKIFLHSQGVDGTYASVRGAGNQVRETICGRNIEMVDKYCIAVIL